MKGPPPNAIAIGTKGLLVLMHDRPATMVTTAHAVSTNLWIGLEVFHRSGQMYRVRQAVTSRPISAWRRLLAPVSNATLEVELEYEPSQPYSLSRLKERIGRAIDLDDDVITQFHEASEIHAWVEQAADFQGVIVALRRAEQEESVRDRVKRVRINTAAISDEAGFHAEFQRALGFLEGYGSNWSAWIDCMSSISFPEHGMSSVTVAEDESLVLEIPASDRFRERCPDVYRNLIECTAEVNRGDLRIGQVPTVLLQLE